MNGSVRNLSHLAILLCTLSAACSGTKGTGDDAGTGDPDAARTCTTSTPPAALFTDSGQYTRELYVDRDHGADENDGSMASPWKSLARAGAMLQAGDRVHIKAGTYFECLNVQNAIGTAANPIDIRGEGEVRIHCMDGEAVAGSGLQYVTLENLIVLASGGDSNAIHVDGNSNHIVLRHNEVAGVGAGGDCIKVNASDDIWVLDNDLHDADTTSGSAQGIDLVAVHRVVVRGNHVHDIADSQGIFAKGGASDVVIERNRIERIVTTDMTNANTIGIVLGGVTDRGVFSPPDAAYEATRVIARNNIVIGADGGGIGAQGCHDCSILNNTLWNTGHFGYAIQLGQGATGLSATDAVSHDQDVHVINNLVGNPFGTMRAPIQAEAPERQGLQLSHNWWWNGERDDVFDPGYNHDVGVDEPNSHVNADPHVIDGEMNDVQLAANSPARGAGQPLDNVTEDFNGVCRANPPDIGALQQQ